MGRPCGRPRIIQIFLQYPWVLFTIPVGGHKGGPYIGSFGNKYLNNISGVDPGGHPNKNY